MALDRAATLKKAEKLLRQGKLEGAIQEYVRVVEDNPRDWNSMNALGDLYARAGNLERAVAQFTRIADYLHDEGFFPKAAALYKKALKTQPDHEPSLLRLAEISTRQGLVAEGKLYWNQIARLRRARGDERGANECLVALGALPDPELKLAAGRAAQALGEPGQAAALFQESAEIFEKQGKEGQALDAMIAAAELDPADRQLRERIVRRCLAAGDVDRARPFLSPESAGNDPDLLLALGKIELAAGSPDAARGAFSRLLAVAPGRSADIIAIADSLGAEGHLDAAFACADVVAETALLAGDFDGALQALDTMLRHGPHVPALEKLVDVAVDAGNEALTTSAQERLADAYLDGGRGAEARVIAEDLLTRIPQAPEHVERLRRALVQAGVEDVEGTIARQLDARAAGEEALANLDLPGTDVDIQVIDVDTDAEQVDAVPTAAPVDSHDAERESFAVGEHAAPEEIVLDDGDDVSASRVTGAGRGEAESIGAAAPHTAEGDEAPPVEIDLSDALTQLANDSPLFAPPPAARADAVPQEEGHGPASAGGSGDAPADDLNSVFARMRVRVRADERTAPAAQLERGLLLLEQGNSDAAIVDLEAAARTPMLRFTAAAALGRFHASRGELESAVEWLERAADSPVSSEEESLAVLYELADALERMGERDRALAVLLEIDADRSAYKDVPERIEQITRAQAGSRRP